MMSMNNWRAKQIRKRNKASQTPGKSKGPTCQTDPIKRFYASHPHAHRDPQYMRWHKRFRDMNLGGASNASK